jgi:hypothetical protein
MTHLEMFRKMLDDTKIDHRILYHPTEQYAYTTEIVARMGDQDIIIDFNGEGELLVMSSEMVPLPDADEPLTGEPPL